MKVFRQFDYFRKSTSPEAIKPTCIGGFVSLMCCIAIAVLAINEYNIYMSPEVKKNTTVSTDPNKRSTIFVNMDIEFPNVPCYFIDVEMKTSVNQMNSSEMIKKLVWKHIGADGTQLESSMNEVTPFPSVDIQDTKDLPAKVITHLEDKITCRVTGSIDVTKVTGQLVFRMKGDSPALQQFNSDRKANPGLNLEKVTLQMNHKVNSLTFGDQRQQMTIKKKFGMIDNGEHTIFNMFHEDGAVNHNLKSSPEDQPNEYFYFIKMVPHIFVDMLDMREFRSYSYSLGHNKKVSDTPTHSAITIILDYAPIKMILTRQSREFGKFAVNLCSIVGGVFIICGLLNSFLLATIKKIKGD